MKSLSTLHVCCSLALFLSVAHAGVTNPILEALAASGNAPAVMTDEELHHPRGMALQQIYNMPAPSVLLGVKEDHVTYLKFGSTAGYRSYRYVGFSYDPRASYLISDGTVMERGVGDTWRADLYSSAYSWNFSNSQVIEHHLQAFTPSGNPLPYGYRATNWNRPASRFSW